MNKINNFSGNLNKSQDNSYVAPKPKDESIVDEVMINKLMQEVIEETNKELPKNVDK